MNIVTIGVSPYVLSSNGKLHSKILKKLLLDGHSVASLVWSHDTSFFFPEEHDGKKKYYYNFTIDEQPVKIPVFPFRRGDRESVVIYEALNQFKPDLIVTVGDITDFLFMHAVKMFCTFELRWLMVYTGRALPIHENHEDLVHDIDGVLCSNQECYKEIRKIFSKSLCESAFIGVDSLIFQLKDLCEQNPTDKFRIMTCAKNVQTDNAPMLMRVVAGLRQEIPEVELYIHTNILDTGDYDLSDIKRRLDPQDKFIKFPSKYVSYMDGISDSDLAVELNASDIFVSAHMTAATSCSVWEALACGCYPLLSDCGSNRDIVDELESVKIRREDILLPCIELMTTGEVNLSICDPRKMEKKILKAYDKIKKDKGYRSRFSVFTQKYNEFSFLQRVSEMSVEVSKLNQTLCVETV